MVTSVLKRNKSLSGGGLRERSRGYHEQVEMKEVHIRDELVKRDSVVQI